MAAHAPTESTSPPRLPDLSLRCASSLPTWNFFSTRNRSRVPPEPPPNHFRSLGNCREDGRGTASRASRSHERVRKGSESQREGRRGVQEGSRHRELSSNRNSSSLPTRTMMPTSESTRRRRSQGRAAEVTDSLSSGRDDRPGTRMAHHQHHHHHHHHYHYHHHYHHFPRQLNADQDQGILLSSATTEALRHPTSRDASQHILSANPRMSFRNNIRQRNSPREAAMEARDHLDERLRSAALLSHRHSNVGLPANFLDEFGLLFDDDDSWSDDEIWEIGVHDWLETLGFEESWQLDLLSSSDQVSLSSGMSKADIRELRKEVFVPRGTSRDKHVGDRFHPDCLSPWLESHGQCPYCRAKVTCEGRGETSSSWSGRRSSSGVSASEDDFVAWLEAVDSGISRFNIR